MKILFNLFFKFLQLFIAPLFFFFFLIAIFLFLKKKKRHKAALATMLLLVLSIILTGNGLLGKLTARYLQENYVSTFTTDSMPPPSMIVILGGGITRFDQVEVPHILSYSRVRLGYQLYHQARERKQLCKILVSGKGNHGGSSEALLFSTILKNMGVPDQDIIMEDKSRNTYENVIYSSKILKEAGVSHVYMVTSGFHMRRAVAMFQAFGITCTPAPADLITTEISIFPNTYNCAFTYLMLREITGLWQFQLYNKLGLNKT